MASFKRLEASDSLKKGRSARGLSLDIHSNLYFNDFSVQGNPPYQNLGGGWPAPKAKDKIFSKIIVSPRLLGVIVPFPAAPRFTPVG